MVAFENFLLGSHNFTVTALGLVCEGALHKALLDAAAQMIGVQADVYNHDGIIPRE